MSQVQTILDNKDPYSKQAVGALSTQATLGWIIPFILNSLFFHLEADKIKILAFISCVIISFTSAYVIKKRFNFTIGYLSVINSFIIFFTASGFDSFQRDQYLSSISKTEIQEHISNDSTSLSKLKSNYTVSQAALFKFTESTPWFVDRAMAFEIATYQKELKRRDSVYSKKIQELNKKDDVAEKILALTSERDSLLAYVQLQNEIRSISADVSKYWEANGDLPGRYYETGSSIKKMYEDFNFDVLRNKKSRAAYLKLSGNLSTEGVNKQYGAIIKKSQVFLKKVANFDGKKW